MTEELIKFLGGATLFLAAAAWLLRSLVSHLLSKDVETFKSQLRAQSDVTLERLKHELRLVAAERESQIHLLQERRATVIAELYSKLVDFLSAGASFASLAEWKGEASKEEKAHVLADKAAEFHDHFSRHKIYFTDDICAKVEAVWKEAHGALVSYRVHLASAKNGVRSAEDRLVDPWVNAWKVMQEKVPPLLKAVQDEFRALLGVNAAGDAKREARVQPIETRSAD